MEYKILNIANKYIFSTELLNKRLNKDNKQYSIIYGTYKEEKNLEYKISDNKIHIVYAGTFSIQKGGAFSAIESAAYLPSNYHMHIIGFGNNDEKSKLLNRINELSEVTKATITYDGLLSGEEYIKFMQKCDIGLSTQNPDSIYNLTSFPSKILSYMANGLRVVTIRIKAVELSAIGNSVFYYEEQTPKAIAETIMSIDLNKPYNSRKLIKMLDGAFVNSIRKLFKP
ncbi:hypothetical protein SDC9_83398 [bioreactor metagenome]|uniref:Glycosyl transferase family 1 domain-containing protein n=1 Tax=bioreactor metagenome TaxID=1076179 RepID=A0A644Z7I7_9ZZZZ